MDIVIENTCRTHQLRPKLQTQHKRLGHYWIIMSVNYTAFAIGVEVCQCHGTFQNNLPSLKKLPAICSHPRLRASKTQVLWKICDPIQIYFGGPRLVLQIDRSCPIETQWSWLSQILYKFISYNYLASLKSSRLIMAYPSRVRHCIRCTPSIR